MRKRLREMRLIPNDRVTFPVSGARQKSTADRSEDDPDLIPSSCFSEPSLAKTPKSNRMRSIRSVVESMQSSFGSGRVVEPPPEGKTMLSCEQLFRQYSPKVEGWFRRQGLGSQEAEDLTQETFLRVHRGMDNFRGASQPTTWIYKIAMNVLLNYHRDRRAGVRIPATESLEAAGADGWSATQALAAPWHPPVPNPDGSLLDKERLEVLVERLHRLSPRMRECVQFRLRGLKYREIAILLGVSIETVKVHLHNAKKQLRDVFDPEGEDPLEGTDSGD